MKKMICSAAMILTGLASFAQVEKGSLMMGITGGLTTQSSSSSAVSYPSPPVVNNQLDLNLALNSGYFIGKGWLLGISVGYDYMNTQMHQNQQANPSMEASHRNSESSSFQVGLGLTKYFSITEKLYFTCGLNANYSLGTISYSIYNLYDAPPFNELNSFSSITKLNVYVAPGFAYFVSKNWGVNFKLNNILNYNQTRTDGSSTTNTFTIAAGATPTLGLSYTFTNSK